MHPCLPSQMQPSVVCETIESERFQVEIQQPNIHLLILLSCSRPNVCPNSCAAVDDVWYSISLSLITAVDNGLHIDCLSATPLTGSPSVSMKL